MDWPTIVSLVSALASILAAVWIYTRQLRLELFEKRVAVYDATCAFRAHVGREGRPHTMEQLHTFLSRRGFLLSAASLAAPGIGASFAQTQPASVRDSAHGAATSSAASGRVKIVSVKTYPVRLWKHSRQGALPEFTSDFDPQRWRYRGPLAQLAGAIIVVIKTDQGITGYGFGGGGRAAVEIIDSHLQHLLLGANALNVELLWDQMYTSANAYGRRGLFVMALSGVDNALWDIVGKHAGQPIYRLLGGTTKEKAPAYFTSDNPEAGLALGFRHIKLPVREGIFEGRAGMQRIVDRLTDARRAIGPENSLMIDCSSRWDDVPYTLEIARRLEPVWLYFIEEPLSPDNVMGYAQLAREISSTLIASGEHEYTHYGFSELLRHQAVDILQPDISWCGGLTSLKRIAVMAGEHGLPFIPHRGGSLYGLPLVLATPHCPLAESFGTGDDGTDLMVAMTPRFENGHYYPSEEPGFGTAIDEKLVLEHSSRII